MILYIESDISGHPRTCLICEKFPQAQKVVIDNYKNLFDGNLGEAPSQKSYILAKAPKRSVLPSPEGYGFSGKGFFFKTSLNCIYDCEYCYLKGMFKNDIPVFFVNLEDVLEEVKKTIQQEGNTDKIWFYSSDYSDIQGMDVFTGFNEIFLPAFEEFENVMMESRTKSADIRSLLDLGFVPQNTEIAYSLNPQEIIDQFEKGTASLQKRLENISTLLDAGWKVGIRVMPLIPVSDYREMYEEFIEQLKASVDVAKLHSVFVGGLMFTKKDFKRMRKKGLLEGVIDFVDDEDEYFVRLSKKFRLEFYSLFQKSLPGLCEICLDG